MKEHPQLRAVTEERRREIPKEFARSVREFLNSLLIASAIPYRG
jgi:hypothetical protein